MTKIVKLRCEAMENPMGITLKVPRLTWAIESDVRSFRQKTCRIELEAEDNKNRRTKAYDSGQIKSSDSSLIPEGMILCSRTRYYWTVRITDEDNKEYVSAPAWFETGIMDAADWKAKWIEPEQKAVFKEKHIPTPDEPKQDKMIDENVLYPCQMMRKEFHLMKTIARGRAYATAHGIYRLEINGQKAGKNEFAPEATCYRDLLQVQTYDITEILQKGRNAVGMCVADGWWAGRIGNYGDSVQYGDKLAVLLQIEVLYDDGTSEIIISDGSFRSSAGPRRYADLYIGEKYDMHFERNGWSKAEYDDSAWTFVNESSDGFDNLSGQNAQPIQVIETLPCIRIYHSPKGEQILDFGQTMAGNAEMDLIGLPGSEITLRYFEETDSEGNYWFELDGMHSQQTDTFILDESGAGFYDPWFTYHGFRYIYISSNKGKVEIQNAVARLIASNAKQVLILHTSDEAVNRLNKNIEWTMRSNLTGMLTDNPDRERAGWTGDLQMAAPTLCDYCDVQAILRRWLKEASYEQRSNGEIPMVIPNWETYDSMVIKSSAGWGDAVIIVPWILYERYGDCRILEECYPMMEKWISYEKKRAEFISPELLGKMSSEEIQYQKYLWNTDFNFGDWMTPSACYNEETGTYTYFTQTLCDLMGTYYFAYSSMLMQKIAGVLGRFEDEWKYGEQYNRIREAAVSELYNKGKILESEFMGAQVLALHMGFYPKGEKKQLIDRLMQLISKKGFDTGFSSTLLIFDLLCENGYQEKAYDFLLNRKFPSWLYEVDQGATSVWESMQAVMPDGTRNAVSFIQPAFCTIGSFLTQGLGGIRPAAPGYRKIRIHPYLTERLDFCNASFDSEQGIICCSWERTRNEIIFKATVPANTNAVLWLQNAEENKTTESGSPVSSFEGLVHIEEKKNGLEIEIGSGNYLFRYPVDKEF